MKEVYNKATESFKEDIISKDGIQVIPVTDAKAAIKFAIIDAIRETVKECSEKARTKEDRSYWSGKVWDDGPLPIIVDKNSILSIADKLIKEL